MLFEDLVLQGHAFSAPFVIAGIWFFGLVGPFFAWLTLTWAEKAARAEIAAQQETQRRARQLEAASQTSRQVTAILDVDELLGQVVKLIRDTFGYYHVAFFLVDAASHEIVLRAGIGQAEPAYQTHGLRLKIGGEGITGRVAWTGQPILCNDVSQDPNYYPDDRVPDTRSELAVPLRLGDAVVGVFDVQSHRLNAFHQDDVLVLQILADQVAIALENARLFRETRQQHAQVVKLSQDLERKVEERTKELDDAREELAHKATQLQQLLAITVRVQEEERGRIARDLHDGSNQLITGTLFELQAAQQSLLDRREHAALEKLETVKALLRKIDAENHRIILGLRPPILDAQGLAPALKWQANNFQQQCRIACSVEVCGQPIRLAPEIEIVVYRIVQESLNNISAHAHAQHVQILADFKRAEFLIAIEDDGVGFDRARVRADAPGQMGLIGMRERAQSIGGQMQVESVPGRGTRITLRVPLA